MVQWYFTCRSLRNSIRRDEVSNGPGRVGWSLSREALPPNWHQRNVLGIDTVHLFPYQLSLKACSVQPVQWAPGAPSNVVVHQKKLCFFIILLIFGHLDKISEFLINYMCYAPFREPSQTNGGCLFRPTLTNLIYLYIYYIYVYSFSFAHFN